jgi:DNA-binding response OmpR family regulator
MDEKVTKQKRVLVIEDESDFAALLKYRLQQKGYETILASDGVTGLEKATHCRPDLIVLDLMLPRMAGLEVCRILRNNTAMQHVPICIMTASDSIGNRASAYRMGAGGYYTKSNQLPDLLKRIDMVLVECREAADTALWATEEFVAWVSEEVFMRPAHALRTDDP